MPPLINLDTFECMCKNCTNFEKCLEHFKTFEDKDYPDKFKNVSCKSMSSKFSGDFKPKVRINFLLKRLMGKFTKRNKKDTG